MAHLKLSFSNLSLLEQLNVCDRQLANLNRLPAEQLVGVRLIEMTDSIGAAHESYGEVESLRMQLKAAVVRRNRLTRVARDETLRACGLVSVYHQLDPHAMIAAGLEVGKKRHPVGLPDAPTYFQAVTGDDDGEVKLSWKRPIRRCWFEIAIKAEGEAEWKLIESSVATKTVIEHLKPGVKYWFRVNAGNAHGHGPWSNPVAARAK